MVTTIVKIIVSGGDGGQWSKQTHTNNRKKSRVIKFVKALTFMGVVEMSYRDGDTDNGC